MEAIEVVNADSWKVRSLASLQIILAQAEFPYDYPLNNLPADIWKLILSILDNRDANAVLRVSKSFYHFLHWNPPQCWKNEFCDGLYKAKNWRHTSLTALALPRYSKMNSLSFRYCVSLDFSFSLLMMKWFFFFLEGKLKTVLADILKNKNCLSWLDFTGNHPPLFLHFFLLVTHCCLPVCSLGNDGLEIVIEWLKRNSTLEGFNLMCIVPSSLSCFAFSYCH
jgi:hypothetical protein